MLSRLSGGVKAQELKKVCPDAVRQDNSGYFSVEYQYLFMLLLKSHQELSERVKELEKSV